MARQRIRIAFRRAPRRVTRRSPHSRRSGDRTAAEIAAYLDRCNIISGGRVMIGPSTGSVIGEGWFSSVLLGSMLMGVLLCGVLDLECEPVAEPLDCIAAGVVDGEPAVVGVCAGGDERGRFDPLSDECCQVF